MGAVMQFDDMVIGDRAGKGGPAAAGLEFLVRAVQGCVTSGTVVGAGCGVVFVVLAAEGGFGALLTDYAELFWKR